MVALPRTVRPGCLLATSSANCRREPRESWEKLLNTMVVKSSFQLTILARTPQRVARVLDELVARVQAAEDKDLPGAMAQMATRGW